MDIVQKMELCHHHNFPLDWVCEDCCSDPMCTACRNNSHNLCRMVVTVPESAAKKRREVIDMVNETNHKLSSLSQKERNIIEEMESIETQKEAIMSKLKQLEDELQNSLFAQYNKCLAKLSKDFTDSSTVLNTEKDNLVKNKQHLENTVDKTKDLLPFDMGLISQFQLLNHKLNEIITTQKLDAIPTTVETFSLSFKPNSQLQQYKDYLEREENKIMISGSFKDCNERTIILQRSLNRTVEDQPEKLEILFECEGRVEADKKVVIFFDCTVVAGNIVVLTDIENSTVKAFQPQVGRCALSMIYSATGAPYGITKQGDNDVFVTIPDQGKICQFSAKPKLTFKREFKTAKKYTYICTLKGISFVVSCYNDPMAIDVIDMQGHILRTIKDAKGTHIFKHPLTLSAYMGKILVCNRSTGAISITDEDGRFFSTVVRESEWTKSAVFERSGNILMADAESRSFYLKSQTGNIVKRYITPIDGSFREPPGLVATDRLIVVYTTSKLIVLKYQ